MSETLIRVEHVSKKFCRNLKRSLWYGLQDIGNDLTGRGTHQDSLRDQEFWAVRDVNFELRRGDCLGLIGRNGAGKTTLLRMLNGLIRPDTGRIEMQGSVGAMIALGAGIKDVLSGRENIYCMAALRGMNRQEASRKIEEIVEFAELGEFIDSPLQTYSSGMRVRLSFAVASVLDPDILLLDEVLAVGDAAFRDKCYHRIAEVRRNAAVIFVSHNMEQVARVSSQALVLHQGKPVHLGTVDEAVRKYGELNLQATGTSDSFLTLYPPVTAFEARLEHEEITSGGPLQIDLAVTCSRPMDRFLIKVLFYNSRGSFAADGIVDSSAHAMRLLPGHNLLRLQLEALPLKNGVYAVAFNLIDDIGDMIVWAYKTHSMTVRGAYVGAISDCQLVIAPRPASS